MEENPKEEKKVKIKKKHTLRNVVIAVLILIITLLCGTYILHTQKLLPEILENKLKPMLESVDKLFGIESEEKVNEKAEKVEEVEENEVYQILAELDEKYNNEDVEIIDSINTSTTQFDNYSEDVRNNISIIIVDQKQGIINNKTGKIEVEPKFDYIFDEIQEQNKDEFFVGGIDRELYEINLKTFKVTERDNSIGHGGGDSTCYYEPNKKEIYTNGYEYSTVTAGNVYIADKVKNYGGNKLDICFELSEDGHELESKNTSEGKLYNSEAGLKVGYFDIKTGKLKIKTEYEKGTFFDNGIAAVKKDGKAYFINEKNEKIYDIEFEDTTNIHNNKAWVKINGKWNYVEFDSTQRKDIEGSISNEENDIEWKEIYKEYILEENLEVYSDLLNPNKEPSISFIDLDSDKIPELLYYNGMEPGPRGNLMYNVYKINDDNEVEEIDNAVWAGPFTKMGYNSKNDTYAFVTESSGISAMEAGITLADKNGIEDKIFTIGQEDAYSLEDNGYEVKDILIKETTYMNSLSEKEKEKSIETAIKNYLPNEELYNK